jgi:hypothetical protein
MYLCRCEWQHKVTGRRRKDQHITQDGGTVVQVTHSLQKEKSVSCHRGNLYGGLRERPKLLALRPERCLQLTACWAYVVGLASFLCSKWWLASDEGRKENDAEYAAVLCVTPCSKQGAVQLSHYSDWATEMDGPRFKFRQQQQDIFLNSKAPRQVLEPHPAFYLMATKVLPHGMKLPGSDVDHSSRRMSGDVPPVPLYIFKAWKVRTFTFISAYVLWNYGKTTKNLSDDSRAQAKNRAANLRLRTRLQ